MGRRIWTVLRDSDDAGLAIVVGIDLETGVRLPLEVDRDRDPSHFAAALNDITPAQQQVLDGIRAYAADRGWAPSTATLAKLLPLSKSAVWTAVARLVEAGFVEQSPDGATLRVRTAPAPPAADAVEVAS